MNGEVEPVFEGSLGTDFDWGFGTPTTGWPPRAHCVPKTTPGTGQFQVTNAPAQGLFQFCCSSAGLL
jgi:hypothetical protein